MNTLLTQLRKKNLYMSQRGFANVIHKVLTFDDIDSFTSKNRVLIRAKINKNTTFSAIYGRIRRIDAKRLAQPENATPLITASSLN